MLFLLEVEVTDPPDVEAPAFLREVVAEWERVLKLRQHGKVLAGGKLVGRRGAAVVFEAADTREMDNLVASLPLFRRFNRIRVTPLVAPEEALASARQLLALVTKE